MNKGTFFRRKEGRLYFVWINTLGKERCKVIGDASLSNTEGAMKVGELRLDKLAHKPDPVRVSFGEVMDRYLAWGRTKSGREKDESTKQTDQSNARLYLRPQWAGRVAKDIEPLEVQTWLDGLHLVDRSKIRNLMSAIYRYGQKYGMIPRSEESNPMKWESCATTSDYEAMTVTPEQAFQIVERLPLFERTLLIVVAVTAVRISEALGLEWSDIDWEKLLIYVRRSWKYGKFGPPKSKASKAPVEMHEVLAGLLRAWRKESAYARDADFVFASRKMHGKQPRWSGMIAQDYLRPVAVELGIIAKDCPRFGFHNFRHSLATFLVENGHDPVVVQRMLRQSNLDTTMIYIHNRHKRREAQGRFIERFMPGVSTGVPASDD